MNKLNVLMISNSIEIDSQEKKMGKLVPVYYEF